MRSTIKVKALFFVLLSILYLNVHAQIENAANDVQTFFLDGDELGQIENSVNLFSGEVSLPIGLINLPGRGGLSTGVTLMYNSNVDKTVDTWNMNASTGILGLGLAMDIPKIVVDNKMTGATDYDQFYLSEGGVSNK